MPTLFPLLPRLPTYFFQRKEFQSKDPYVVAAEPGLKHGGSAESLMDRTGKMKGNLMGPDTKKAQGRASSGVLCRGNKSLKTGFLSIMPLRTSKVAWGKQGASS